MDKEQAREIAIIAIEDNVYDIISGINQAIANLAKSGYMSGSFNGMTGSGGKKYIGPYLVKKTRELKKTEEPLDPTDQIYLEYFEYIIDNFKRRGYTIQDVVVTESSSPHTKPYKKVVDVEISWS